MMDLGPIWMLPFSKGGRELLGEIFLRQDRTAPAIDPPEFVGHGTAAISVCPHCNTANGVKHPVYFTYICVGCGADLSSEEMNKLRNHLSQADEDGL